MLTFILRRVLSGLVLIVVITVIAFTLLYLGSGNIARTIVGQNATQETVARRPRSSASTGRSSSSSWTG